MSGGGRGGLKLILTSDLVCYRRSRGRRRLRGTRLAHRLDIAPPEADIGFVLDIGLVVLKEYQYVLAHVVRTQLTFRVGIMRCPPRSIRRSRQ